MSLSICRFMPMKSDAAGIRVVNFVLETELKKLSQPFFRVISTVYLVTRGNGIFKFNSKQTRIARCSMFAVPSGNMFELCQCSQDFEYAYISFMGDEAEKLLSDAGINNSSNVFDGFEGLISMWLEALRRINEKNADILSLSILLYTFSYLDGFKTENNSGKLCSTSDSILSYIQKHYDNPNISLRYVAGIFNYTQKYLSSLFKKKNGIGFCEYINILRIQKAQSLIDSGETEIVSIAASCGYTDPLYFSKVFKARTGATPSAFIKNHRK